MTSLQDLTPVDVDRLQVVPAAGGGDGAAAGAGGELRAGAMFPGQGTQKVGMGRVLERSGPAAAAVFDLAADVLGRDVRALCFGGPIGELTLTQNAQVAVFTCNAAAAALVHEAGIRPRVLLGHSVGELNALVEAGSLSLTDGLRLVAERGRLMGLIDTPGAMAATLGLGIEQVSAVCAEVTAALPDAPVVPALHNGPENVVVSGAVAGVEAAEPLLRAAGARKVTRLTVSSAFHSPLMGSAVAEWTAAVAGVEVADPQVPVALNTTGALARDAADVRAALVAALTGPVRWVENVRAAVAVGVDLLIESGDCKVLGQLVRAVDPAPSCPTLSDPRVLRRLREGRLLTATTAVEVAP